MSNPLPQTESRLAHLQLIESMLGPVVLNKVYIDKPLDYYKFMFQTYHKKLKNMNSESQKRLFDTLQIMESGATRKDNWKFFCKMFQAYKSKIQDVSLTGNNTQYPIKEYFFQLNKHLASVDNEAKILQVPGEKDGQLTEQTWNEHLFSNEIGDKVKRNDQTSAEPNNIFSVIQQDFEHKCNETTKLFYYQLYDITCCELSDDNKTNITLFNKDDAFNKFKKKMNYENLHVTNFLYISCLHQKFCESILETYLLFLHYDKKQTEVTLQFSMERLKDICSSKVKLWILGGMNFGGTDYDKKKAKEEVEFMTGGEQDKQKTQTQTTIQKMIIGNKLFENEFENTIQALVQEENDVVKQVEAKVKDFLPKYTSQDFFGDASDEKEIKDILKGISQFINFLDTPFTTWNQGQVQKQNLPLRDNLQVDALQSEEDRLAFTASLMTREMTLWSRSKLMKITSYIYYVTQIHYMLRLWDKEYHGRNENKNKSNPKRLLRNLLGKNNINYFQPFYSKQIRNNDSSYDGILIDDRDFNKECLVLQTYFAACNSTEPPKFENVYEHMRSFNMTERYGTNVKKTLERFNQRQSEGKPFKIDLPTLDDIKKSLVDLLKKIHTTDEIKNMQLNQPLNQSLVTVSNFWTNEDIESFQARRFHGICQRFTTTSKQLFDFLVKIDVISGTDIVEEFQNILTFQQLRYFYLFINISWKTLNVANVATGPQEYYEQLSKVYDFLIVTSNTLLSPFFNTCMSQRTARPIAKCNLYFIEDEEAIYVKDILQNYFSIFEKFNMLDSKAQYDSFHKNLSESFWWDILKESCSRTALKPEPIIPNITVKNFFATDYINASAKWSKATKTLHIEFSPFHNLNQKNELTHTKNMHLWIYDVNDDEERETRKRKKDNTKYYNHFKHEIQEINLFGDDFITRKINSLDAYNDSSVHTLDDEMTNELNPKAEIFNIFGLKELALQDNVNHLPILYYFSKTKIDEDEDKKMELQENSLELLHIQGRDPYVNKYFDLCFGTREGTLTQKRKFPQALGRYFPCVKEINDGKTSIFQRYLKEFFFKDESFKHLNEHMKNINKRLARSEATKLHGTQGVWEIRKNDIVLEDVHKKIRCIWLDDMFMKLADDMIHSVNWSGKEFDSFSFSLAIATENGTDTSKNSQQEYIINFPESIPEKIPNILVEMAYKMIMEEYPLEHEGTDLFLGDDMARCKKLWSQILDCVTGDTFDSTPSALDLFCIREIASYHFGLFIMEAMQRNSTFHEFEIPHKREIPGFNLHEKEPVKICFYKPTVNIRTDSANILEASMKWWLNESWVSYDDHLKGKVHNKDQTIFYTTKEGQVFRFADSLLSSFTLNNTNNEFCYHSKKLTLDNPLDAEKNYMILWDYGRFICGHHSRNPLTSMFDMDNNSQWTSQFDSIFQYNMENENLKVSRNTELQEFHDKNHVKALNFYEKQERKMKKEQPQPHVQQTHVQDKVSNDNSDSDSDHDKISDGEVEDDVAIDDEDVITKNNNFQYLLKLFKVDFVDWTLLAPPQLQDTVPTTRLPPQPQLASIEIGEIVGETNPMETEPILPALVVADPDPAHGKPITEMPIEPNDDELSEQSSNSEDDEEKRSDDDNDQSDDDNDNDDDDNDNA